jgi:hypothetical protein
MPFGHFPCTGFAPGIHHFNPVVAPVTVKGMHVKITDKSAAQHGYFFEFHTVRV